MSRAFTADREKTLKRLPNSNTYIPVNTAKDEEE
jgi:hypothetical protein